MEENSSTCQAFNDSIRKEIKAIGSHIHPPVPNPAPLGLFAFGLTTALLQMKHTRLAGSSSEDMEGVEHLTWGFSMFYGGLLQVIAGLSEIRRNNIFGYTAFLSYGGFWMSLGTAEIVIIIGDPDVGINSKAVQAMLFLMGIFTAVLWICTFTINKTICALMFMLMMTFFLLVGGVDDETTDKVAGWFGIVTAAIAYWLGMAELVNDIAGEGHDIIPLGHWSSNNFKSSGAVHAPEHHRAVLKGSRYVRSGINASVSPLSARGTLRDDIVLENTHDTEESHVDMAIERDYNKQVDLVDLEKD